MPTILEPAREENMSGMYEHDSWGKTREEADAESHLPPLMQRGLQARTDAEKWLKRFCIFTDKTLDACP